MNGKSSELGSHREQAAGGSLQEERMKILRELLSESHNSANAQSNLIKRKVNRSVVSTVSRCTPLYVA